MSDCQNCNRGSYQGGPCPACAAEIDAEARAEARIYAISQLQEGSSCPDGCGGTMQWPPPENCSCHLGHAPCASCMDVQETCTVCGMTISEFQEEVEEAMQKQDHRSAAALEAECRDYFSSGQAADADAERAWYQAGQRKGLFDPRLAPSPRRPATVYSGGDISAVLWKSQTENHLTGTRTVFSDAEPGGSAFKAEAAETGVHCIGLDMAAAGSDVTSVQVVSAKIPPSQVKATRENIRKYVYDSSEIAGTDTTSVVCRSGNSTTFKMPVQQKAGEVKSPGRLLFEAQFSLNDWTPSALDKQWAEYTEAQRKVWESRAVPVKTAGQIHFEKVASRMQTNIKWEDLTHSQRQAAENKAAGRSGPHIRRFLWA